MKKKERQQHNRFLYLSAIPAGTIRIHVTSTQRTAFQLSVSFSIGNQIRVTHFGFLDRSMDPFLFSSMAAMMVIMAALHIVHLTKLDQNWQNGNSEKRKGKMEVVSKRAVKLYT